MNQPVSRLTALFRRYQAGALTAVERQLLLALALNPAHEQELKQLIGEEMEMMHDLLPAAVPEDRATLILDTIIAQGQQPLRSIPFAHRYRWVAAAVLLLLMAGVGYVMLRPQSPAGQQARRQDVPPGRSGAVLHLSNGQTIALDSVADGLLARQGGMQVIKEGGLLKYTGADTAVLYNTIETAKGRQWQLLLPDGTKVWLNAGSSIQYPLRFAAKERVVAMTGEAYFEVTHRQQQPFRVQAGKQIVEDLGTSFNVNTYTDEPAQVTTLVEGLASVSSSHNKQLLHPGEQAVVAGEAVTVMPADATQNTAWRRGLFSFKHTDVPTVMRQLARWYNVEVEYKGKPDLLITGEMGRDLSLLQVLQGLEKMQLHVTIEGGNRMVIRP